MAYTALKRNQLRKRIALNSILSVIQNEMDDINELIDLTETHLKKEFKRLGKHVFKEIEALSNDDEKQIIMGWYADDFNRMDKVFPIIHRRSLFITLMCMTESNLILVCQICKRIFNFKKEFKKKGKERVITQALSYLKDNLTIRDRNIKTIWELFQELWSIRNIIVHNNGIPKAYEIKKVEKFCNSIPTFELDDHNRIILKEGSVQMVSHHVNQFFIYLRNEIERNN